MDNSPVTEAIGWISSFILLATISRQVLTQWKSDSTQGVSRYLFAGQLAASVGFVVYSARLGNWVFVFTNALMLLAAIVGLGVFWRNRRREHRAADAPSGGQALHAPHRS